MIYMRYIYTYIYIYIYTRFKVISHVGLSVGGFSKVASSPSPPKLQNKSAGSFSCLDGSNFSSSFLFPWMTPMICFKIYSSFFVAFSCASRFYLLLTNSRALFGFIVFTIAGHICVVRVVAIFSWQRRRAHTAPPNHPIFLKFYYFAFVCPWIPFFYLI